MKTTWKKIIRDLWLEKRRTLLVIIALTIATFSISMISTSYFLLKRDLQQNYMITNPASSTLWFSSVDSNLINKIKEFPGIEEVEATRQIPGRILIDADTWLNLIFFVKPDFDNMKINTMQFEEGDYPIAENEVFIERSALKVINADIGDTITVKTPGGIRKQLIISGRVHAPGLPPAWMENSTYAFITPKTFNYLELKPYLNQVNIIVSERPFDKEHIIDLTIQLKKQLEKDGYHVIRTHVEEPGVHPHQSQIGSYMYMQALMCVIILFVSSIIIVTMISALMAGQIRQIGIMKSIGGKTYQILMIYLSIVLILGLISLVLGVPSGIGMGIMSAEYAAKNLNFNIFNYSIPGIVIVLQVIVSIMMPILIAILPIYRSSRISIREALNDYGISQKEFGNSIIDKVLTKIKGIGPTVLLAFRNTFRNKGRLILTLGTLSIAGAAFLTTFVMRESMLNTITQSFNNLDYNANISFYEPYRIDELTTLLQSVTDIDHIEYWGLYNAVRIYDNGTESEPNSALLNSVPVNTKMIVNKNMIEGRWLNSGDTNNIVVNQYFIKDNPDVKVNDHVDFKINDNVYHFKIVGIIREPFSFGNYINYEYFNKLMHEYGYARNVKIKFLDQNNIQDSDINQAIENKLENNGYNVQTNWSTSLLSKTVYDHFAMLIRFLVIITVLILIVGSIGILTTMGINVMERSREIGILRAIGSPNIKISGIVIIEGVTIAIISWVIAIILSYPFSLYFSNNIASLFIQTTADYIYSHIGVFSWLFIALIFSILASFIPSRRATRISVSESLRYE